MTTKLVHGNYAVWIVKTRATLMRKFLIKYIDGQRPDQGQQGYDAWDVDKDMKALGIIIEALYDTQLQYITGSNTAKGAWYSLRVEHEPQEELDQLQLEREWNAATWDWNRQDLK